MAGDSTTAGDTKNSTSIFKSLASIGAIVCRNCRHLVKHQLPRRFSRLINTQAKSVSTAVVSAMLKWSQALQPDGEVYRDCRNGPFPKICRSSFEPEMIEKWEDYGKILFLNASGITQAYSPINVQTPSSCHPEVSLKRTSQKKNHLVQTWAPILLLFYSYHFCDKPGENVFPLKSMILKYTKILELKKENKLMFCILCTLQCLMKHLCLLSRTRICCFQILL